MAVEVLQKKAHILYLCVFLSVLNARGREALWELLMIQSNNSNLYLIFKAIVIENVHSHSSYT